jgi:hypothetical protein
MLSNVFFILDRTVEAHRDLAKSASTPTKPVLINLEIVQNERQEATQARLYKGTATKHEQPRLARHSRGHEREPAP